MSDSSDRAQSVNMGLPLHVCVFSRLKTKTAVELQEGNVGLGETCEQVKDRTGDGDATSAQKHGEECEVAYL